MLITTLGTVVVNVFFLALFGKENPLVWFVFLLSVLFLIFTFRFFRVPNRPNRDLPPNELVCPADGKVVVIEKVQYAGSEHTQVSIFMSPLNVHINWYPIDGTVAESTYKPGKFLVAWHPKSSELNEQHEVVMQTSGGNIGLKQIAGAVARRIVNYAEPGSQIKRGDEMGFIKFGSRVDVLLPTHAEVLVNLGQKVTGNQTVLARV